MSCELVTPKTSLSNSSAHLAAFSNWSHGSVLKGQRPCHLRLGARGQWPCKEGELKCTEQWWPVLFNPPVMAQWCFFFSGWCFHHFKFLCDLEPEGRLCWNACFDLFASFRFQSDLYNLPLPLGFSTWCSSKPASLASPKQNSPHVSSLGWYEFPDQPMM